MLSIRRPTHLDEKRCRRFPPNRTFKRRSKQCGSSSCAIFQPANTSSFWSSLKFRIRNCFQVPALQHCDLAMPFPTLPQPQYPAEKDPTELERSEIRNVINTLRTIEASQPDIFALISNGHANGFFGKYSTDELELQTIIGASLDYKTEFLTLMIWNPRNIKSIIPRPWPEVHNDVTSSSGPVPRFFVYQNLWKLSTQGDICFNIQTRDTQQQFGIVVVNVETPRGHNAYVKVIMEATRPPRYACSFRAVYNGKYFIRASIDDQDIEGSPVTLLLTSGTGDSGDLVDIRNYNLEISSFNIIYQPLVELCIKNRADCRTLLGTALDKPWGIAANPKTEELYLTFRDTREVHCYTHFNGNFFLRFKFGQVGDEPKCFKRPTGIAVDSVRNRLLIVDKDNHRVSIFKLNGEFLMTFGSHGIGDGEFNYPWGIAVSMDGKHIAVTDFHNNRVQLFDSNGEYLRQYCPYELTKKPRSTRQLLKKNLSYPRGITFDNTGTLLYVTDFNQETVFTLNLEMTTKTLFTPYQSIVRPQGLAVSPHGYIAVCEPNCNGIRVYTPDAKIVDMINVALDGPLMEPCDVTYSKGRFFVLETSGRIRILFPHQKLPVC